MFPIFKATVGEFDRYRQVSLRYADNVTLQYLVMLVDY